MAERETGIRFETLPRQCKLSVRAALDAVVLMGEILGIALPTEACRSSEADGRAALWLGPDEWLVLMAAGAVVPSTPPGTSIVDMSHGYAGIGITGAHAPTVISAFCALDLHISAFPLGMCTRTLFGKAQIVLWRTNVDTFRIEVARSVSPYVWQLLQTAGHEFLD